MTIGETIRKYRAQAGMSQTALAEKIGVTQQQIEKWENGKRRPKLDALKNSRRIKNTNYRAYRKIPAILNRTAGIFLLFASASLPTCRCAAVVYWPYLYRRKIFLSSYKICIRRSLFSSTLRSSVSRREFPRMRSNLYVSFFPPLSYPVNAPSSKHFAQFAL